MLLKQGTAVTILPLPAANTMGELAEEPQACRLSTHFLVCKFFGEEGPTPFF